MIDPRETAKEPFLRLPGLLHGGAFPAAATHAGKRDHRRFTETMAGRVAGADVIHFFESRLEVLHFPASFLS